MAGGVPDPVLPEERVAGTDVPACLCCRLSRGGRAGPGNPRATEENRGQCGVRTTLETVPRDAGAVERHNDLQNQRLQVPLPTLSTEGLGRGSEVPKSPSSASGDCTRGCGICAAPGHGWLGGPVSRERPHSTSHLRFATGDGPPLLRVLGDCGLR